MYQYDQRVTFKLSQFSASPKTKLVISLNPITYWVLGIDKTVNALYP